MKTYVESVFFIIADGPRPSTLILDMQTLEPVEQRSAVPPLPQLQLRANALKLADNPAQILRRPTEVGVQRRATGGTGFVGAGGAALVGAKDKLVTTAARSRAGKRLTLLQNVWSSTQIECGSSNTSKQTAREDGQLRCSATRCARALTLADQELVRGRREPVRVDTHRRQSRS